MFLIITNIYNELKNSYKYLKQIETIKRVIFFDFFNNFKKK